MRKKPEPLEHAKLMELAVRSIGGRALTIGELRRKLSRRAAEPADVERVIASLKDAGALDDSRFADSFAASRLENQGFGKMRVLRDLRARRVAPAVAEKAVSAAYSETDENSLIEQYLERKFRGKDLAQHLQEEKNLLSIYRKLRLAGFSGGNSIRVLKNYSRRADELEDSEPVEE